jgi:hypothetical protein
MGYVKNSKGCEISASFHKKSDFFSLAMLNQERENFKETIRHRLVDITFWHGREVCLSICGTRTLKVPKSCKTLRQVAEWINTKNF